MDRELRDRLLSEVPGLKHYRLNTEGVPFGDWFVFETNPLPTPKEIEKVIADLQRDRDICLFENGTLGHSKNCRELEHHVEKNIKKIINKIPDQKFRFAVWENTNGFYGNQPIVIALDPEINFNIYPEHPHINGCIPANACYLPESLCYTDNPLALGNNIYDRTKEAIEQACIWLFGHQVWLATRQIGKGIWVIPDVKADESRQFASHRSPFSNCRCGSKKKYIDCHLDLDFRRLYQITPKLQNTKISITQFKMEDGSLNVKAYTDWWAKNFFKRQLSVMEYLKKTLV